MPGFKTTVGLNSPGRKALSFGTSDTSKTFTFKGLTGMLIAIIYEQYDTTSNATGTVAITNKNNVSLFSKSSLADGANTLISVRMAESKDVPILPEQHTVTVTLSEAPGNAGTVYVTLVIV